MTSTPCAPRRCSYRGIAAAFCSVGVWQSNCGGNRTTQSPTRGLGWPHPVQDRGRDPRARAFRAALVESAKSAAIYKAISHPNTRQQSPGCRSFSAYAAMAGAWCNSINLPAGMGSSAYVAPPRSANSTSMTSSLKTSTMVPSCPLAKRADGISSRVATTSSIFIAFPDHKARRESCRIVRTQPAGPHLRAAASSWHALGDPIGRMGNRTGLGGVWLTPGAAVNCGCRAGTPHDSQNNAPRIAPRALPDARRVNAAGHAPGSKFGALP